MSEKTLSDSGFSQVTQSCLLPRRPKLLRMPEMLETARPAFWTDRPAAARLRPPRPRPVVVDVLAAAAGIGLGVTIGLEVTAESAGSLSAPGGVAIALGRLTGLLAAYAMVVVVLLVARVPPLERAIGQDRLVGWHRKLGPWPLYLLLAHAVLITVGYARQASDGVLHQFGQLLWTYPGVLAATAGSIFLFAAGISSYRLARKRMAYETWWSVHLYTYLALFLSFSHQIDTGASFVGHPLARAWWTMLWLGTLGVVVAARIGLPLWRSLRHQVRVVAVRPEGPGVASIVLRGRRLDRLPVAGGQFFQWRFLRRGLWWQAHPYSLSAAPDGDLLRITVKDLGDHSAGLARLAPGTRVAIEGPYGAFTADTATTDRLLLIGAGVGTAPILVAAPGAPAGDRRRRAAARLDARRARTARRGRRRGAAARRPAARARRLARHGAPGRRCAPQPRAGRARARGLPVRPRAARAPARRRAPARGRARAADPLRGVRVLMRRSPIVLAATVAGTAGVMAFHPHTPAVQPAAATTTATPPKTATSTASGARTATGVAVDTQYGAAQVRVTVKGGKITDIEALQLQGNDPRSLQISSSAEPILKQEALAKQSADIDAVSGASFTSASYTQSLQSALDKLGFKSS